MSLARFAKSTWRPPTIFPELQHYPCYLGLQSPLITPSTTQDVKDNIASWLFISWKTNINIRNDLFLFCSIIWSLWLHRNDDTFNLVEATLTSIIARCNSLHTDWLKRLDWNGRGVYRSPRDDAMITNSSILLIKNWCSQQHPDNFLKICIGTVPTSEATSQ